jgi:hypothetical protein
MKTLASLLVAGALAFAPAAGLAKIVRQVEQAFPVAPGGTLRVQTMGGDIRVATADVTEVKVTARQTFRTDSEKEADEILAAMTFRIAQEGNDVVAEARSERKGGWFGQNKVTVDFTVTVPRRFNAELSTSGGDIGVGDLTGTVKARTSGGDLDFARIAGDLEGRTSGGDITLVEGTARAELSRRQYPDHPRRRPDEGLDLRRRHPDRRRGGAARRVHLRRQHRRPPDRGAQARPRAQHLGRRRPDHPAEIGRLHP